MWFHGSDASLAVGEALVPGDTIGKDNFPGMENSWGVWISPSAELAAKYGANVYAVAPVGDVTDWCEENGWEPTADNAEFVCGSALVVAALVSA
jgi:hypothetical protein